MTATLKTFVLVRLVALTCLVFALLASASARSCMS